MKENSVAIANSSVLQQTEANGFYDICTVVCEKLQDGGGVRAGNREQKESVAVEFYLGLVG